MNAVEKKSQGMLIVLSAPAGCGKDTIVQGLLNSDADIKNELNLFYSISATTRNIRFGEEEGKHYFFMSKEKFEKLIEEGEFLEYTKYCGNYYGTRRKTIMNALKEGKNIILKIECEGAENVKKMFPDAVTIFVLPPSVSELRRRLFKRATECECVIDERIAKAMTEIAKCDEYDYRVTNDVLQTAIEEVAAIIRSERDKRSI